MGKRLAAFTLAVCLLLSVSGCKKISKNSEGDLNTIQKQYESCAGLQTNAHIVSNLDERTLEYDIKYEYNKESGGRITIISPEELAGITAAVDGDSFTLHYEDTALETAMPDRKGLTPADAVPYLLSDIKKAYPTEIWRENGKIAVHFEQTTDDGAVSKEVYFDEKTGALCDAELYLDGKKLLGCTFSEFQFQQ